MEIFGQKIEIFGRENSGPLWTRLEEFACICPIGNQKKPSEPKKSQKLHNLKFQKNLSGKKVSKKEEEYRI